MAKPSATANLAAQYPEIAKQWHPTKNGTLRPESVSAFSNKKVWWQCPKDPSHIWDAVISTRHKAGCRHCYRESKYLEWVVDDTGKKREKLLKDDATLFAELVATDEERSRLGEIYVGDTRTLSWKCSKCNGIWSNQLRKGAMERQGCTYCSNQTTNELNSLAAVHAEIASQWDWEKNNTNPKLAGGPGTVNPGSHERAWWLCAKGHSWQAEIRQRASYKTGCRQCGPQVSRMEIRLGCEMHEALGIELVFGEKMAGWEADIQIPSLRLVVELDGFPWHSPDRHPGSFERDIKKTAHFNSLGFNVIRVREARLPTIDHCISVSFEDKGDILSVCKEVVASVANLNGASEVLRNRARDYLLARGFVADGQYKDKVSKMLLPAPGNSLTETNPELVEQWSAENLPLTPDLFTPGSDQHVIWRCAIGHEWPAAIYSRAKLKTGCPACSGRIASSGNSLAELYPEIAAQWAYQLNDTDPTKVTPKSSGKYWWECKQGHQWDAIVNNRVKGNGCPYCSRKLPTPERNLFSERPDVAMFFNTARNGLKPQDIMPSSGKTFSWLCQNGHEWPARVDHQVRYGARCRECEKAKP